MSTRNGGGSRCGREAGLTARVGKNAGVGKVPGGHQRVSAVGEVNRTFCRVGTEAKPAYGTLRLSFKAAWPQ